MGTDNGLLYPLWPAPYALCALWGSLCASMGSRASIGLLLIQSLWLSTLSAVLSLHSLWALCTLLCRSASLAALGLR
jgi:hypothetical protein